MIFYDKRIRYLNFYENNVKQQNAGYIRFQVWDRKCIMSGLLKFPKNMGDSVVNVNFLDYEGQEKLVGSLQIHGGQGACNVEMDTLDLNDTGLSYDEIYGIRINLDQRSFLESRWTPERKLPEQMRPAESESMEKPMEEVAEELEMGESEPEEDVTQVQPLQAEEEMALEDIKIAEVGEQFDKWESLKDLFPIVHPLEKEEEYLKIAPKDFIVLSEESQELANNSFLLHGFYNYDHLILGRKEKEGENVYYVGVPGIFHEREKNVAVMFGFEAFEGKKEPPARGDFGYYFIKVKL